MNHLKLFIFVGFVIMFAAGILVGRVGMSISHAHGDPDFIAPTSKPEPFPTIGPKLNLNEKQRQSMAQIWKDARTRAERPRQAMEEADQKRDADIHALLSAEQSAKYEQIQHDHELHVAALRGEISKTMHDAELKTRELMTPEQREKFEQMVKEHGDHADHGPRRGPPMSGAPHHHHWGGPGTAPSRPDTLPSGG